MKKNTNENGVGTCEEQLSLVNVVVIFTCESRGERKTLCHCIWEPPDLYLGTLLTLLLPGNFPQ